MAAVLLAVLGILVSCEAFDAATGNITKPVDPAAPATQVATPPSVVAVQAVADQSMAAVVSLTAEVARLRAEAATQPGAEDVAGKLAKAEAKLAETTAEAAKWKGVLDQVMAGLVKPAETPAEKVHNATDPILPFLPQPVGTYATIAAGLIGWVLTLIQKQRTAAAKAESKANLAMAENAVWSVEKAREDPEFDAAFVKIIPVLDQRQSDATKALVQRVTD
jgi:hypothetical protein